MADIELVIKIPKNLYKATVNGLDADEIWDLRLAVKNGTPLNDMLDKIRDEIDIARFFDKDTKLCKNANASGLEVAMQIIDKYKAESEGEK